jgi:hypothetical protein
MKKTDEFNKATERIRDGLFLEFDELANKKAKNELTEKDLEYYLARDRKAAIILKTLQMDMQYEILALRRGINPKGVSYTNNKN